MAGIIPSFRNRVIRGIRDSLPSGSVIGRASRGDGAAEVIPLTDLVSSIAATGTFAFPTDLSDQFDAAFGATEGMILQRGPLVWQVLAPGSSGQYLSSGGPAALNSWATLPLNTPIAPGNVIGNNTGVFSIPSATPLGPLLDFLNSVAGSVVVRDFGGWTAIGPGTSGQFLMTRGNTTTPAWANAVTTTGSPSSGNLTKFSGAGTITNGDLSGDVTTGGALVTTLANSGVTAGTYTNSSVTVDAKGRVTAASSGAAPVSGPVSSTVGDLAIWGNTSGTVIEDKALVIGSGLIVTVTSTTISISSAGMLPLVTGDTPGPTLIADGSGQCIGVPLS